MHERGDFGTAAEDESNLLPAAADVEDGPDDLEQVLASLPPPEVQHRLEELNVQDSKPTELKQVLLRRWAIDDPGAAANWVEKLPAGPWRNAAEKQLVLGWAASDAAAAWDWGDSRINDPQTKSETLRDLAYETISVSPTIAIEIANRLPADREGDDLLVHAVSEWSLADRSLALEWAEGVEDAVLRKRLLTAIGVATVQLR